MPGNPNPRSRRDRESDRQRAHDEAVREAYQRAARRRAALGIGVVVVVVIAVGGVIFAATNSKKSTSTTTTTTPGASTTAAPGPTVSLPTVSPGEKIAGTPTCPAADGSSPRATEFEQAPPMCIDPTKEYEALIATSKGGPMKLALTADQYPQAVNLFAFLAGYHYYDGLPVTRIVPQAYAEVGDPTNADGQKGPGFTIRNEAAAKGPLSSPLLVALVPNSDGTVSGSFLFGLAGQFTQIPSNAPQIGMVLDDRVDPNQPDLSPTVPQAINKAATASGAPSEVITITSVTVAPRA